MSILITVSMAQEGHEVQMEIFVSYYMYHGLLEIIVLIHVIPQDFFYGLDISINQSQGGECSITCVWIPGGYPSDPTNLPLDI